MKRNVWIINHYATEMYRSGGGRHHWFAKELVKNGYNPIIICSNVYYTTSDQSIPVGQNGYQLLEKDGIRYVMVKTSTYVRNDIKRVKNILDFYFHVLHLSKEIAGIAKPDIVIGSSIHPLACAAGIRIARRFNIPCISEIRDLWPEELIRDDGMNEKGLPARLLFALEHWIYKRSDALIFTMEGAAQYIRDRKWDFESGGDIDLNKVHYINNGVYLKEFDQNLQTYKVEDKDLEDDAFRITYTGAIRKTNGVERLIRLGRRLADIPDVKILIYGDGDHMDSIRQMIREENIHNVLLKGRVDKKYIPYILSKSSMNILNYTSGNSFYYGCSNNKLFEYLAAGKPILCTVRMNYSIIRKYDCGVEVETDDEIESEIRKVYKGRQEAVGNMSINARNVAKDYDFEKHTQSLINIISSL